MPQQRVSWRQVKSRKDKTFDEWHEDGWYSGASTPWR